jgi:hypothetical protein
VVRGRAGQPSRHSILLLKFVRSVPLSNYAACKRFIDENPEVWDTDKGEYAERAVELFAAGDEESRALAFSCLEKLVVLNSCKNHPPGTTFLTRLRSNHTESAQEFSATFGRLKAHCEAQAKTKSERSQDRRPQTTREGRLQQKIPDGNQSRQERTRTEGQDKPVRRSRETDRDLDPGRQSAAASGSSQRASHQQDAVVPQRPQPREPLDRLDSISRDRHSHQHERSHSRDLFDSSDEDATSTDAQSLKDGKPQGHDSRHSAAPGARRDSYSTNARSTAHPGVIRQGSHSIRTPLPIRQDAQQSSERHKPPRTANLKTPIQPPNTGQQRRDGAASREAQASSSPPGAGQEPAPPPGVPPRHPDDASFRATNSRDPSFEVIPPSRWDQYFQVGRMFAVLMYTEYNRPQDARDDRGSVQTARDRSGREIYSHFQRLVVVGRAWGLAWAIPINTYQYQGLKKRGLSASNIEAHAIIHMVDTPPLWLPGEPQSSKRAIKVIPETRHEALHQASRINFEKVHSVDLNVRIHKIGMVPPGSLPWLNQYFQEERARITGSR